MNPTHVWSEVTLKDPGLVPDPNKEYPATIKLVTARINEGRLNLTFSIDVDNTK